MDKSTKELLAQAEKLCAQRNVRLTPQRLEVLRLMTLQQGRHQRIRPARPAARKRATG